LNSESEFRIISLLYFEFQYTSLFQQTITSRDSVVQIRRTGNEVRIISDSFEVSLEVAVIPIGSKQIRIQLSGGGEPGRELITLKVNKYMENVGA
jgi:hypothetical protein